MAYPVSIDVWFGCCSYCQNGGVRTGFEFNSSKRMAAKPGQKGSFEVNRRMVLMAREIGCGHASLDVSYCRLV